MPKYCLYYNVSGLYICLRVVVYEMDFVVAIYCCLVYRLLFFSYFCFECLIINNRHMPMVI